MLNSQLSSIRYLVSQLPSGPSHSQPMPEYCTMEEMKTYMKVQKQQVESHERLAASVDRLEAACGNMAKAHLNLQADFKKEKESNKKKGKFMIKMWRGIKAICK